MTLLQTLELMLDTVRLPEDMSFVRNIHGARLMMPSGSSGAYSVAVRHARNPHKVGTIILEPMVLNRSRFTPSSYAYDYDGSRALVAYIQAEAKCLENELEP